MTARHPVTGRFLSGDCEIDCQQHCAYPGQFTECGTDDEHAPAAASADTKGTPT